MLARIHIYNKYDVMDQDVYVEVEIPYPLQVDNFLYLKRESIYQLEKMATANLEIANRYFPLWFYGNTWSKKIDQEDLDHINFDEANVIRAISYREGNNYLDIELYSRLDYELKLQGRAEEF